MECGIQRSKETAHVWILGTPNSDKYQYSRTKVIGKAIGDCVAGRGPLIKYRKIDVDVIKCGLDIVKLR